MISQLREALDHLDQAQKLIKQYKKQSANRKTSFDYASEKIDIASEILTGRLQLEEQHAIYVAKGGKPWPAILEEKE